MDVRPQGKRSGRSSILPLDLVTGSHYISGDSERSDYWKGTVSSTNMSEFDELQHRFKDDVGHFLLAIQTVRVVDVAAFERVDGEAAELARLLKGQSLVPKSLLWNIRAVTKIL